MDVLLTRDRLPDVVAEVDRIAQERGGQIERADAEGVLRELGLPAELLDEALAEVRKRDAARRSKKRMLTIGLLVAACAGGAIAFGLYRSSAHQSQLASVTTRDAHLAYDANDASALSSVTRDGSRDVFFSATLLDAPQGAALQMACDWRDPAGALFRESRYETKPVDRATWPTHCKTRIGNDAPVGTWKVTMKLDGKSIAEKVFDVK